MSDTNEKNERDTEPKNNPGAQAEKDLEEAREKLAEEARKESKTQSKRDWEQERKQREEKERKDKRERFLKEAIRRFQRMTSNMEVILALESHQDWHEAESRGDGPLNETLLELQQLRAEIQDMNLNESEDRHVLSRYMGDGHGEIYIGKKFYGAISMWGGVKVYQQSVSVNGVCRFDCFYCHRHLALYLGDPPMTCFNGGDAVYNCRYCDKSMVVMPGDITRIERFEDRTSEPLTRITREKEIIE